MSVLNCVPDFRISRLIGDEARLRLTDNQLMNKSNRELIGAAVFLRHETQDQLIILDGFWRERSSKGLA